MKNFQDKPYLERGRKRELAMSLNISEKRIADWFHHRRQTKRQAGLLCTGE